LDSTPNGDPKNFAVYHDKLYFNADAGKGSASNPLPYKELHSTDGTTEGTTLVFDANPVYNKSGNPQKMYVFNDLLYMELNDGTSTQLWAHDGDTTVKVENPYNSVWFTPSFQVLDTDKVWFKGTGSYGKSQLIIHTDSGLTELTTNSSSHAYSGKGTTYKGGFIFRGADDEDGDSELWYSDGTKEGTAIVLDIDTADSSSPEQFTIYNDKAYFVVSLDDKTQIWESDATAEGTQAVVIPTDTIDVEIENLTVYAEKLFFTLTNQDEEDELWMFDGATSSKVATIGTSPAGFIEVDGLLFFISGKKLWYTEGYEDVTMMVDSAVEGNAIYSDADDEYAVIGSTLYFTADDSTGYDDIYAIDASTIEKEYLPIVLDGIASLHLYNDELFFEAEDENDNIGDELYKRAADGSISLVADINQDPEDSTPNSDPRKFIEYKGLLYFQANGGDFTGVDVELFVTDGTTEGTELAYDFYAGPKNGGLPMEFFIMNDTLYMYAKDGANSQIWKYDGVNSPIKVTNERDGGFFNPFYPVVDNDRTWLKGITSYDKYQLCLFDGDTVISLTNNSVTAAYNNDGILFNNGFLFTGVDEDKDKELWFSDGTIEGTAPVLDLDTADSSSPAELTVYNDEAYFTAVIDGKTQIWKTDATAEGTMLVYDPTDTIEIENLNVIQSSLVFTAEYLSGTALYKITDTEVEMLAVVGDSPEDFYEHDDLLFFVAGDSLWSTEGTALSTKAVAADVFTSGVVAQDVDGGEFVSEGTLLHFVAEADDRDVIVTIDASDIERDPAASINDNKALAASVNLFPMPSAGVINIESAQSFTAYKVFDLSMKELASSSITGNQINVSLEKGMYILQLEDAETRVAKTIMIK